MGPRAREGRTGRARLMVVWNNGGIPVLARRNGEDWAARVHGVSVAVRLAFV
jgi:hypothetical protein